MSVAGSDLTTAGRLARVAPVAMTIDRIQR
jgi:hypothetical protein